MILYKDSDVHITYEEQQKINKFARQNAKLEDYKEELRVKQVICLRELKIALFHMILLTLFGHAKFYMQ